MADGPVGAGGVRIEDLVLAAASGAGVGIVIADLAAQRILAANPTACEMLGLPEAELLSRPPLDMLAPGERQLVVDRLRRRLLGESLAPPQITVVHPGGRRVRVQCNIGEIPLEGGRGAIVFLTAVGAPQAADLAADARYRELVEAAPDGVTITRGSRFLYLNQLALGLLGCATVEELRGRTLADFLGPDDLAVMRERTIAMMRDGARFAPRDYRLLVPGREPPVVEVHSMAIDFEGGPAVLAFVRDVTDTRRAQAANERTERLAALGTLVAGVAHEVNNPLSFAALGAELLTRYFDGGCHDPGAGRAALASVTAGLERVAAIVRDLRAFSRVDGPALRPLHLATVLESALRMTGAEVRLRARLEVELGELPVVRGDAHRLEQVLVNLIVNAAQSFVAPDVARNVVRVRAARDGAVASITVEDNGPGIAPELLPRVLDPFFTTKPVGLGTGLGLSISDAIVAQHGGRLEVASRLGVGTTVEVRLPVHEGPVVDEHAPSGAPSATGRARVLVVDDERHVARALSAILAPAYDVTVATSGPEADALLTERAFDAVLCDLQMPELPGVAVFERASARSPAIARRFVFMTGGVFGDDLAARLGGPDTPCLEKPFSAATVRAAIERALAR